MKSLKLNQQLTPKSAGLALAVLALAAGLFVAGAWGYRHWKSASPSPRHVKSVIRDYLQAKADRKEFKTDYDFTLKEKVLSVQTNALSLKQEVTSLQTNLAAQQEQMAALRRDNAQQADLTAKQKELAALRGELAVKQKAWTAEQKDLAGQQQELASQQMKFVRETRQKVGQAGSYAEIYAAIGQELWLADQLLASQDQTQQRNGVNLAVEAIQHSTDGASDLWLAARICEGYLWPNLELADLPGKPKQNLGQLLQLCTGTFQRAEETNNIISNYKFFLDHGIRVDYARYYLAYTLEQAGQLDQALQYYKQVESTNFLKHAKQRIPIVEQRQQQRASAK
jgi:hypothetical protein